MGSMEHRVGLPDGQVLALSTAGQERFFNAVVVGSPARGIPAEEVVARLRPDNYQPNDRDRLKSVYNYYRNYGTLPRPYGWRVGHRDSLRQGDWGTYFIEPTVGENGFYPYVVLLDHNDRIELENGRTVAATTLTTSKYPDTVSFSAIINQAFEVAVSRSGPPVFREATAILAEHNQLMGRERWIRPMVVRHDTDDHHIFLRSQSELVIDLLRQSEARLDPLLPFHVTRAEMVALNHNDEASREKVRDRLMRLGLRLFTKEAEDVDPIQAQRMVSTVVDHKSIWQQLLNARLPLNTASDFQKYFRVSILRRVQNLRRDTQRDEKRQAPLSRLEGSPLRDYFLHHPVGTPEATRLLLTLSAKQETAFVEFFLNREQLITRDNHWQARKALEKALSLPQSQWPQPKKHDIVKRLVRKNPEFANAAMSALSDKEGEYIRLSTSGLSSKEIATRLNIETEGAVRSLAHRIYEKLSWLAIRRGFWNPQS